MLSPRLHKAVPMYEIFAVANIVGGTIVIPHTRRAAEYWEELQNSEAVK